MSSGIASTAGQLTGSVLDNGSVAELTPKGKLGIRFSIISTLFLSQIAYNVGEFPFSVDFFCYALFAAYLLVSRHLALDFRSLLLVITGAALAAFRIPFASPYTSWTSLLLLLALYVPFAFRLSNRQDLQPVQEYIEDTFISIAIVISLIALVQLVLVNATKSPLLMNIHFVLPEAIRSAGSYAYTREGTGLIKANGYFLRESATLSLVMAQALILEYYGRSRWRVLGILAVGLITSFSGSGILALIAGFVLPRSIGRTPVFIATLAGVIGVLFVLYSADVPFLNSYFARFDEFTTPNTSGYARFIAPFEMTSRGFQEFTSTWLGNGAGTYLREAGLLKVKYEVNDPTWAKLLYEYGVLGSMLVSSIFIIRLYSSALRVEACNFFLFSWLISGLLLKPEFVLLVWLLTLVPTHYRRTKPAA
jgi:hypothetical protein